MLTVDQSRRVSQALSTLVVSAGPAGIDFEEGEEEQLLQLAGFFQVVAEQPERFRPQGRMATSLRPLARAATKGPAQRPKRKRRR